MNETKGCVCGTDTGRHALLCPGKNVPASPIAAETECEAVVVDGAPVLVRGHLGPEDMEPFEEVVRGAKEFVRRQPSQPCHSPRCDYEEPHNHGYACGRGCLCGKAATDA